MRVVFFSLLWVTTVEAAHWAVLVAGSNGYQNYRHQADVFHAYQVVKAKGIPEKNIIVMAYDDIAHYGPLPGKVFNKPDPNGPGVDVYNGVNIDYKGADVTPDNFLAVLNGTASGKSLKSTSEDNVFVFFSDHGAKGLMCFPSADLHKNDFQQALWNLHSQQKFKKLVFYLETCDSGSMFKGMNIPGLYALSASKAGQSSWATYCGGDDQKIIVNGTDLGYICLGDLFSVSWMEDSDSKDTTQESLDDQFAIVKKRTCPGKGKRCKHGSNVIQWGDQSFKTDEVSDYEGDLNTVLRPATENPAATAISSREVDLRLAFMKYNSAVSSSDRLKAGKELQTILQQQLEVESAYRRFVSIAYPEDDAKQDFIWSASSDPDQPECELAARDVFKSSKKFDSYSGFALQFHQVIVNVCADVAQTGANINVVEVARRALQETAVVV